MWHRRTKSKTRTRNSFSCSSFKDVQSLCADDDDHKNNNLNSSNSSSPIPNRRASNIFHRVRRANAVLSAFSTVQPKDRDSLSPLPQNPNAHVASVHHQLLHHTSLPVLPSEQNGDSKIVTVKEDPALPLLPPEQKGDADIVPDIPSHEIASSKVVAPIQLPGGEKRIVIYFTSLRIVRSTFEACKSTRTILRSFGVAIDERDLSMDSSFACELQKIFGHESEKTRLTLPRVFIDGRYIGGAEEVWQLHELGELKEYVQGLRPAKPGDCEVCGGQGFILCDECSGSRKIYSEKTRFRACTVCNENGLVRCISCSSAPL